MHAFMRHNRESDLSFSQVNTLFRLYHHGPSSVNDLADHLGITMAGVSQLLNQLIDAEFIKRSISTTDRRVKLIALTEHGELSVEKSMRARHAWINELVVLFTPNEKKQMLPTLELLNHRIQNRRYMKNPQCGQKNRNDLIDEETNK